MNPEDLQRVPLAGGFHLWQSRRGHRTGTDDILCAYAGWLDRPGARRILDLGAGHGAVTLMLAAVFPEARIVAIEAQEVSHALLVRNIEENRLSGRVRPIRGDLRDLDLDEEFDLVTGTPPFIPLGKGTLPANPQRAAARFEMRGGFEDYATVAARSMAPGASVSLVMDGLQDDRCRRGMAAAGLVLTRVIRVRPRTGRPPTYIVYQGRATAEGDHEERDWAVRGDGDDWTETFAGIRATLELPERSDS